MRFSKAKSITTIGLLLWAIILASPAHAWTFKSRVINAASPAALYVSGTIENPIVDSSMSFSEAVQRPSSDIPGEILDKLVLVDVVYLSFDGKYHQGQIVIDSRLSTEVREIFGHALELGFPIQSAIPVSHDRFGWDDSMSMQHNNTSAFNYRAVTGGRGLSPERIAPRVPLHVQRVEHWPVPVCLAFRRLIFHPPN